MIKESLDLSNVRAKFPALRETDEQGRPYVYFDGPGGTQVPQAVIDAMADYFRQANANQGGHFITSLTFHLSRSVGRILHPGDEIIVTRLDHDANIAPWRALEEQGATVKWVDFDVEDCRLDLDHLASLLSTKTKLVAVGYASNAVGTINPIRRIAAMAHEVGAWLYVDAVHFAPHGPIDVEAIDCDFLVCSPYKFFGPHMGVLWGRLELLEQLQAYKVRPSKSTPPHKFETGTLNHEGIAGVTAAIDYLADLGRNYGHLADLDSEAQFDRYQGRRRELKQAMHCIAAYERPLFATMLAELDSVPGLTIYGITNPAEFDERCPTLAFTREGFTPQEIAAYLGEQGIFVWDGNYYALSVTERLGVEESGGMVRVGLAHYNTKAEVDRFVTALRDM